MPKPAQRSTLSAFFVQEEPGTELEGARLLPLNLIDPNPSQARQVFDETALQELADSIAAHGVLEPILVRPVGDRYQIVAGERRVRAAKAAGLGDVPAIIRLMDDQEAAVVGALENLQRMDLTVAEEIRLYQTLRDNTGLSARKLGDLLHRDHNRISRALKIASDPATLEAVQLGEMTFSAAWDSLSTPITAPPPVPEVSQIETVAAPEPTLPYGPLPAKEPAARPIAPAAIKAQAKHKPFVAAQAYARKLNPADLPPSEWADLGETIDALIAELQGLRAALSED